MSPQIPKRRFTASELTPGKEYRLVAPFVDFDGVTHPIGERFRFLAKNFLPYEDGLTLFIERDGRNSVYRLQWRPESQAHIIDNFSDFVEEV